MAREKQPAQPAKAEGKKEEKLTIPAETFEVEGTEYRFTAARFIWKGQPVTAEKALKDEKLLATLVEIGAGVIEAV